MEKTPADAVVTVRNYYKSLPERMAAVRARVGRPLTLAEMKANAKLKNFDLVRLARLSVMPVSDGQWKIMEGMVRR